jgi:poly(glycerol-phosphate) alpha-glucosyltransferase
MNLPPLDDSRDVSETPTPRVLLFLSRLNEKKGLGPLIDAWSAACRSPELDNWKLVIAGWGEPAYAETIERKRKESTRPESIEICGPAFGPDKKRLLNLAEGFVLPSFSEGLPMSILEAWSHGLPVLMTRHCNLSIGFARGASVEVSTDATELAAKLRQFCAMESAARREMGARGRALVEEKYTWGVISVQMAEMYKQLA